MLNTLFLAIGDTLHHKIGQLVEEGQANLFNDLIWIGIFLGIAFDSEDWKGFFHSLSEFNYALAEGRCFVGQGVEGLMDFADCFIIFIFELFFLLIVFLLHLTQNFLIAFFNLLDIGLTDSFAFFQSS